MNDKKTETSQVAVPKEIMREVKIYAAQNYIKIGRVVELALIEYLKSEGKK